MRPLSLWLVAGILGLSIFVLLFSHAFPVASVDIKLSREEVSIITRVAGITLRGTGLRDTPGVLNRAFYVCASQKVNVIMASTTVVSATLYVAEKNAKSELLEMLQKEFEVQ